MNQIALRRSSTWLGGLVLIFVAPVAAIASGADEREHEQRETEQHEQREHEREGEVPEPVEVCLSCHAIAADEPALEGPTLWQVMGRRIAAAPDFEYSAALRKQTGAWDRDSLDRFLAAPQVFAPGVNMTFGGVKNAADRKVVLDFLETLRPATAPGTVP